MLGLTKRKLRGASTRSSSSPSCEDFIDAPVKTYSSGMYMRLGFAVAIHVDPDVLLIDEVLAVGDEAFTHKCLDKFAEFRRRSKTILLVTHSLNLVERFCDEALWLDGGRSGPRRSPARRRRPTSPTSRSRRSATWPRPTPRRRSRRRRVSPDEPASAVLPDNPDRDRDRTRPTCFRPPRAAGARARSRSPTSA